IAILLAARFGLPHTRKPDTTISLKPKPILKGFAAVLRNPQFATYAFSGAIAFSGLFTYVAGSPMVFMDIFQTDEKTYGWIFAFMSLRFIGASQLNALLLKRLTSEQLVLSALMIQCIVGVMFLVFAINGWLGLYETIAMLFLFLACLGLSNPNTAGLSLAPFSRTAGSAAALLGALQLGLGAIASVAVGIFVKNSMVPLVWIL